MDVSELKARARAAVVQGRLEHAEVLYRQLLTRVPRDAGAWLRHAETLRRLDRVNDAVWSYRTASTILLAQGHEARAIAGLKLALGLKPDDVDLVTEIIRVELHRHRRLAVRGQPGWPSSAQVTEVPLEELDRPQLALPMLGPVDLRASAGSGVAPPASPGGPGLVAGATAAAGTSVSAVLAGVQRAAEAALGVAAGPPVEYPGPGLAPLPGTPVPAAPSEETVVATVEVRPSTPSGSAPTPRPSAPPVSHPPPRPSTPSRGARPSAPRPASPWPQIRRLNDREVAIKASPDSPWVHVTSGTTLEVRITEVLAIDEETPWVD